jgi:hypothetical protein
VIDNLEKTDALIEKMRAVLPMHAGLGVELKGHLMEQFPEAANSGQCEITDIIYSGDFGGIVCYLALGGLPDENAYVVSITHLAFGRGSPLSREIAAYQKHRVKRLKKEQGRAF